VAAIGNLVTHPTQRGKGYARVVTAALLRETFKRVANVTLDVEDENTPAMRLYQHFGFRHSADFWEGELSLRK
jgi:ribosomal protein S18 acetylase RimI-like enzyme